MLLFWWVFLIPWFCVNSAEGERVWRSQCWSSKGVASSSCSGNLWNPHVTRLGRAGAKGSTKAATYSLQPKVFPLPPLYWMWGGKRWKEQPKNLSRQRDAHFERSHFHREKEALTLQLMGYTLTLRSVWTGKQHLCWGWHLCHPSSVVFQSTCPEGLQVSGCCNCANFQYFDHLEISTIAYFRVALADHVLHLSQREKVKSDLLERVIKSAVWYDVWPVMHSTADNMGWKPVWAALRQKW